MQFLQVAYHGYLAIHAGVDPSAASVDTSDSRLLGGLTAKGGFC
jgi:hypothetical protein